MPEATYILCIITSLLSALLLARGAAGSGGRLMLWGAVFFVGMAINNALHLVDASLGEQVDWSLAPNLAALVSIGILLYALIWEAS
jgi:hypothetical protein